MAFKHRHKIISESSRVWRDACESKVDWKKLLANIFSAFTQNKWRFRMVYLQNTETKQPVEKFSIRLVLQSRAIIGYSPLFARNIFFAHYFFNFMRCCCEDDIIWVDWSHKCEPKANRDANTHTDPQTTRPIDPSWNRRWSVSRHYHQSVFVAAIDVRYQPYFATLR